MLTSVPAQDDLLWDVIAGFDADQSERFTVSIPEAISRRLKEFAELHEIEAEEVILAMINRYFGEQTVEGSL